MHCTMVNTMEAADRPFSSTDPASRPVEHGPVSPRAGHVRREFGRSCSDAVIATPRSHDPLPPQSRCQQGPLPNSEPPLRSISQSFASTPVGYLANRWNLGSSFSTPSSMGRAHDDTSRYACNPRDTYIRTCYCMYMYWTHRLTLLVSGCILSPHLAHQTGHTTHRAASQSYSRRKCVCHCHSKARLN